jgi:hypothetical protein
LRAKVLSDARANVAAYLLATADAKGRSGVARMDAGPKIADAIVLEAEKYKKGTADKTDIGYGQGIGIIISFKSENTRAEYTITVPKAGEYELELRYAALESRPVRVSVEGKVTLPNAAKGTRRGSRKDASRSPKARTRSPSKRMPCCRTSTRLPCCRWKQCRLRLRDDRVWARSPRSRSNAS